MDIEGRLLSAHRRSQIAMMQPAFASTFAVTANATSARKKPPARLSAFLAGARGGLILGFTGLLLCRLIPALHAQYLPPTGPQELSFAGLRTVANQGQINAVQVSAQGEPLPPHRPEGRRPRAHDRPCRDHRPRTGTTRRAGRCWPRHGARPCGQCIHRRDHHLRRYSYRNLRRGLPFVLRNHNQFLRREVRCPP